MNNILFFDTSRKDEMQSFLERIYQLTIQNPNLKLNNKIVYNQLRFGLLPTQEKDNYGTGKNNRQFFEKWSRDFSYKRNINAFCDDINCPQWFQFLNKLEYNSDYIKLFIPINATHLYRSVAELFSFIEDQNIIHASQIAQEARLDNVVIRLNKNDVDSLSKIIDYINKNKYIKTGLNTNIPFVPTINGIGVMNDHGNSYIYDISIYICNYILQCISQGIKPNIDGFRDYIKLFCFDKDLVETFENAYSSKSKFKIKNEKNQKDNLSLEQKTYLLIDALKATYMAYGINQARIALEYAVNDGEFSRFTNGEELLLREKLKNNISSKDIMQIIKYALPNFIDSSLIERDEHGKINQFINILFGNQLVLTLDEACLATIEKYDTDYLIKAIKKYISYDDPTGFTRHYGNSPVNYRKQIILIKSDEFLDYLKTSLKVKGYDIEDEIDKDIPTLYANSISNSRYTSITDSPILSR